MMKATVLAFTGCTLMLAACAGDDDDTPRAAETEAAGAIAPPSVEPTASPSDVAEHCPSSGSVQTPGPNAPEEAAVAAVNDHLGTDLAVSDVIVGPATESPYSQVAAAECGQEVVELSWFVRVCSVPCAEETSASLPIDYFLAKSEDQWLVYFEY
jgi:hypothetical protein